MRTALPVAKTLTALSDSVAMRLPWAVRAEVWRASGALRGERRRRGRHRAFIPLLAAFALACTSPNVSSAKMYNLPRTPQAHLDELVALLDLAPDYVIAIVDSVGAPPGGPRVPITVTVLEAFQGMYSSGERVVYLDYFTDASPLSPGERVVLPLSFTQGLRRLALTSRRYHITDADSVAFFEKSLFPLSVLKAHLLSALAAHTPAAMRLSAENVVRVTSLAGPQTVAVTSYTGNPHREDGDLTVRVSHTYRSLNPIDSGSLLTIPLARSSLSVAQRASLPLFSADTEYILFLDGPLNGAYTLHAGARSVYRVAGDSAFVETMPYSAYGAVVRLAALPLPALEALLAP